VELLLNKEGLMSLLSVQGTQLILQVNGVNNVVQSLLNLVDGLNTTVVDNGDGSVQIDVTAGGTGTVTSVSASVPSPVSPALSVSVTNPTTTPNISISANGSTSQYQRGDGSLANFPTVPLTGGMYIEKTFISNIGAVSLLWLPSVNKVYCANHSNNTITIYNATNGELTNTLTLNGATHLVHVQGISTPEIWAFATGVPSTISRINISAAVAGENIFGSYTGFGTMVSIGNSNDVLEFSSTKGYISQVGSNSIGIVNPTTGALTGTIAAVGTSPTGMAHNTNGSSAMNGRVVVGTNSGVTIINESTNAITALNVNPSSLISNTRYVKYVPSLDMYIVASSGNQRLVFLQPLTATTFTVLTTIAGMNGVSDIYVDEPNGICYVSHTSGQGTTNVLNLNITSINLNNFDTLETIYGNITGGSGSFRSKISADSASRRFFVTMINSPANGTFVKIKY
jgi:hypothetical protein